MSRQKLEEELAQNKAAQVDLGKRFVSCQARLVTPSDPDAYFKSEDFKGHLREDKRLLHEALALQRQLKELGPRTLAERWQGYFFHNKQRQEQPGGGARGRDVEEGLTRRLLEPSST